MSNLIEALERLKEAVKRTDPAYESGIINAANAVVEALEGAEIAQGTDVPDFLFTRYTEFWLEETKPPTFHARYNGTCDVCGFNFSFNHSEPIPITETPNV